jgi:hypothetical protein
MRYSVKSSFIVIPALIAALCALVPLEAFSAEAVAGAVDMPHADFTTHWAG